MPDPFEPDDDAALLAYWDSLPPASDDDIIRVFENIASAPDPKPSAHRDVIRDAAAMTEHLLHQIDSLTTRVRALSALLRA